jgi:hypothetical protein
VLVSIDSVAAKSNTPASKSVVISLSRSRARIQGNGGTV